MEQKSGFPRDEWVAITKGRIKDDGQVRAVFLTVEKCMAPFKGKQKMITSLNVV